MPDAIPPLFQDDDPATETLVCPFGFDIARHMREMWEWFRPYADQDFDRKVREAVQGLYDHAPGEEARRHASHLFHRCYWEMYVGCALLEQGIKLVPRDNDRWDNTWSGAGPDLMAEVDGCRVWVECVAPGAGDGADAVPEPPDNQAFNEPVQQINLRLHSAIKEKRQKYKNYVNQGIVNPQDGYVVAINAHLIPCDWPDPLVDDPPEVARTLYGLGRTAVTVNLTTNEFSEAFLTRQPSITKQNEAVIDTNLFGNGKAAEVSGVIYSTVDAWNLWNLTGRSLAHGILYVHNLTAKVPLPDRWLPQSVSYSVSVVESKGTITRADP